jgi:hypothetical protein
MHRSRGFPTDIKNAIPSTNMTSQWSSTTEDIILGSCSGVVDFSAVSTVFPCIRWMGVEIHTLNVLNEAIVIYMYYTNKLVSTNLYELHMLNHSWFINIKIIFDQSAVSSVFEDITDNWIVSEQQIKIVLILIHGEPAFIAEYWRAIAIANIYFVTNIIWRSLSYRES